MECETPYTVAPVDDPITGDKYKVIAEGVEICCTSSLLGSFNVMGACFYISNIAYPKAITATLMFIQISLLSIQDSMKKNTKVIKLLNEVTK